MYILLLISIAICFFCSLLLFCKYIQQGKCLRDIQFKAKFRTVVMVENRPERVFFQSLIYFPRHYSNLSITFNTSLMKFPQEHKHDDHVLSDKPF